MVLLRNAMKVAACVSGCAVAAKFWDDGTFWKAYAATATAQAKTFDEHFPRGTWDDNWDYRSPSFLLNAKKYAEANEAEKKKMDEEVKAKATRNIFLIRHGQYFMDSEKKNLTPLGKEQAALLGKRLATSGMKFDSLVMSTMVRATETAEIILEQMPELKRTSCSLIEEGPPYPPIPAVDHWKPPHSEFFAEGARIESAFRRHIHRAPPSQKEDSYEIIVCHANVIRYFVCRALQFPPEGWLRMSLGNCSITWLVIRPSGRVSLRSLGDIGHLPPSKVSFT
ncbi:phosphoglycerate mutase family protein [Cooperia oncophora]